MQMHTFWVDSSGWVLTYKCTYTNWHLFGSDNSFIEALCTMPQNMPTLHRFIIWHIMKNCYIYWMLFKFLLLHYLVPRFNCSYWDNDLLSALGIHFQGSFHVFCWVYQLSSDYTFHGTQFFLYNLIFGMFLKFLLIQRCIQPCLRPSFKDVQVSISSKDFHSLVSQVSASSKMFTALFIDFSQVPASSKIFKALFKDVSQVSASPKMFQQGFFSRFMMYSPYILSFSFHCNINGLYFSFFYVYVLYTLYTLLITLI